MRSRHATWRPVAYTGLHGRQSRRAVILHTNGGPCDHGSLFGFWSQIAASGKHIGAHFQVATGGRAEQYVDTTQVIYHAYSASEWAVGIETEDDGHPDTPWTQAQLDTIIAICRELSIPGKLLADGPSDGVGWHEQYADWNRDGHHCPGTVREHQIRTLILPALTLPTVPLWWHRPLRLGMTGLDVLACKRRLSRLGYRGVTFTPRFSNGLFAAVQRFQHDHHLKMTGVVDRTTAHAIRIAR